MGQIEVFEFLRIRLITGDKSYHTIASISKGIKERNKWSPNTRGVGAAVVTLEAYGYLDVKMVDKHKRFRRAFRLKKKYIQ